VNSKLC